MASKPKQAPIALPVQMASMKKTYGDLIESLGIANSTLSCVIKLQPASDCQVYRVRIRYKISDYSPKAWLVDPELQRVNGKLPHHIYGYDKSGHPQLCVYYPRYNEWNRQMLISHSFIPWIITWLNTYEYWLITGEWFFDESPRGSKKG